MKKIILLVCATGLFLVGSAQIVKDTSYKLGSALPEKIETPKEDLDYISIKDLNDFLTFVRANATVDQYGFLTPDRTLSELYKWAVIRWNKDKKKVNR